MGAAVFSDVSPRSPRHGLHSVAAGNAKGMVRVRPHRPFSVSCGADRVFFVFLFWCLFLETVGEVCILHKLIIAFLFILPIDLYSISIYNIVKSMGRIIIIMKETKTKPLLQVSAKYISGICYDEEGLSNFVKDNNSVVDEYAYILHDRDVKEDGSPKEPHYHFLFVLHRSRRLADIQSAMKKTLQGNVLLQPCRSVSDSYGYLTHENDDCKVHYDESSIVSSADSSFWKADTSSNDCDKSCDTIMSAYLDLLNSMPLTDCAKKYGRDFIIHYNHIKSLLLDSGLILDKGVYRQRGDFVNYNDDFMYRYKNGLDEDYNVSSETNTVNESE